MNVVTPRVARGHKRRLCSLGECKKERTRLKEQKKGEALRDNPLARTSSKRNKNLKERPKRQETEGDPKSVTTLCLASKEKYSAEQNILGRSTF